VEPRLVPPPPEVGRFRRTWRKGTRGTRPPGPPSSSPLTILSWQQLEECGDSVSDLTCHRAEARSVAQPGAARG
jgi:hypothetical protein